MKYLKLLVFFNLFFIVINLYSELKFIIDADVIGISEYAEIQIHSSDKISKIKVPESKDYIIEKGGVSSSSSISIINGVKKVSHSYIYTYYLYPRKQGEIIIDPFEITITNVLYKTEPKKIIVKAENQKKSKERDIFEEFNNFFNRGFTYRLPEMFFELRIKNPRNKYYINQPIIVEGYLCADDISAFDFQFQENTPIYSEKMIIQDLSRYINNNVFKENNIYYKLVKTYIIFPLVEMNEVLKPPEIVALTPAGAINLKSKTFSLKIDKLKNNDFAYIGDIELKLMTNDLTNIKEGDVREIKYLFTGNGNLKAIPDFLKLVNTNNNIIISKPSFSNYIAFISNDKVYFKMDISYKVNFLKEDKSKIDRYVFNYFDERLEERKLIIPEIYYEVKKSLTSRYFDNYEYLPENNRGFNFIYLYLIIILIGICYFLPAIFYFIYTHKRKLSDDDSYRRRYFADKMLNNIFNDAMKCIESDDVKNFATLLKKGIYYYYTDKYNLKRGLTKEEFEKELIKLIENKDNYRKLISIIKELDMIGFSGSIKNYEKEYLKNLLDTSREIILNS